MTDTKRESREFRNLIAKQIMEQLSAEDLAYARSTDRGEYRGFAALHDRFDANTLIEEYADDIPFCNEVIDIVNDLILAESKDTTEPIVVSRLECGCEVIKVKSGGFPTIRYCPLHKVAPDMLKALETTKHAIIRFHVSHGYCSDCKCARSDGHLDTCSLTVVRAAIDQAKGE